MLQADRQIGGFGVGWACQNGAEEELWARLCTQFSWTETG